MKKPEIWAHRGASAEAPENTLEAFLLAAEKQADGVELDVQLSKDGELVVIHDETIDRVSNGIGWVKDYTLKELKKLNVNKTHPQYIDAKIPTLREVFELLEPTSLKINVELKTGIHFYPGIEQKVYNLVAEMGLQERIWYSSFNHYSLKKMKRIDPQVKTGVLYADGIYDIASYAKAIGADAIHPALYNLQYPGIVEACKENGLKIHVWTVNEIEEKILMENLGVDAIITNYP